MNQLGRDITLEIAGAAQLMTGAFGVVVGVALPEEEKLAAHASLLELLKDGDDATVTCVAAVLGYKGVDSFWAMYGDEPSLCAIPSLKTLLEKLNSTTDRATRRVVSSALASVYDMATPDKKLEEEILPLVADALAIEDGGDEQVYDDLDSICRGWLEAQQTWVEPAPRQDEGEEGKPGGGTPCATEVEHGDD